MGKRTVKLRLSKRSTAPGNDVVSRFDRCVQLHAYGRQSFVTMYTLRKRGRVSLAEEQRHCVYLALIESESILKWTLQKRRWRRRIAACIDWTREEVEPLEARCALQYAMEVVLASTQRRPASHCVMGAQHVSSLTAQTRGDWELSAPSTL